MGVYKTFPCKWCSVFIHWGQDPSTDKFVAYAEDGKVHNCPKKPKLQFAGASAPVADHFGLGSIARGKLPDVKPQPTDDLTADERATLATVGVKGDINSTVMLRAISKMVKRLIELEEVFGAAE